MAELTTALFTHDIIVDQQTGMVSLIKLVEGLQIVEGELAQGGWIQGKNLPLRAYTRWLREGPDDESLMVRAVPVTPQGERREEQKVEQLLEGQSRLHRWFFGLPNWTIDMTGMWLVVIEAQEGDKWVTKGHIELDIKGKAEPS